MLDKYWIFICDNVTNLYSLCIQSRSGAELAQLAILAFWKTEKLIEKSWLENLAIQKQSKREKWKELLSFVEVMH